MNLPPKLKDTDIITTSISHSAPSLLSLVSKVSAVGDCKSQASSYPEVHRDSSIRAERPQRISFPVSSLFCIQGARSWSQASVRLASQAPVAAHPLHRCVISQGLVCLLSAGQDFKYSMRGLWLRNPKQMVFPKASLSCICVCAKLLCSVAYLSTGATKLSLLPLSLSGSNSEMLYHSHVHLKCTRSPALHYSV